MIELTVRREARAFRTSERRRLLWLLGRVMKLAGARGELSLLLCGSAEMRRLNRRYADEDHATDVLSFESRPPLLGDIIIALPIARRQAAEKGHSLFDELFHLAVHGLCHLIGYDHRTPAEERRMFGYETSLRKKALQLLRRRANAKIAPGTRRRKIQKSGVAG
jgi:probable rRNA maturation factor